MRQLRTTWILAVAFAISSVACSQSDPGITTAIKTRLAADDEVKAYQIDVDTQDKVVTLNGTVDNARAKTRAADIARAQKGVFHVVDNIAVIAADATSTPPDATLMAAVKTKLIADLAVSGRRIDVDARTGVITLSGEIGSQAEKDIAVQIARDTTGVRDVIDRLVIVAR